MRICRDKQIRGFFLFLTFFAVLLFGLGIIFGISQINDIKTLYLTHDEAVASSLLEQGIPKDVIAVALTNTEINEDGQLLLAAAGIGADVENNMLPFVNQFQQSTFYTTPATYRRTMKEPSSRYFPLWSSLPPCFNRKAKPNIKQRNF